MDQFIITHPDMAGILHTVGIIVIEATGDFSWIERGASFNGNMLDEMTKRGITVDKLAPRNAEDGERHYVAVFSPDMNQTRTETTRRR